MTTTVERSELHAVGRAVVEEALGLAFPGITLDRGGSPRIDLSAAVLPGLSWFGYALEGPGFAAFESPGLLTVSMLRGRVAPTQDREPLPLGAPSLIADDVMCVAPFESCRNSAVILEVATVRRVAARHWGRPVPGSLFTGFRAVDAERATAWERLLAFVSDAMLSHPDAVAAPLVREALVRQVCLDVLHLFPNRLLADPPRVDVHGAVPATVRRALEYIDAHAHEAVTVDDVAAAVHLSPRGLQVAFRRTLDETPSEALRRARLDAAHRDLAGAEAGSTTVAAVAHRWGFAHAGKFAARYREAYGEHPSATRAR
jgi:AraC-like DNA-binding protein